MNKQSFPPVPNEDRIEQLLTKIRPVPSEQFHQKMKQAIWQVEERRVVKNFRTKIAFAILTLATITALLITPQGRAWAQEIFRFFKQVTFTSIPLSQQDLDWLNAPSEYYDLPLVPVMIPTPLPELAAIPGCKTAEDAQTYFCQIAYAESKLGFDLKEVPQEPPGLEFWSVDFDSDLKSATIGYGEQGWSLSFTQRLGKAPEQYEPWSWVPVGEVEKVKVGSFDGEYVSGHFSFPTGGKELVWDVAPVNQRLAWSDGRTWYLLESSIGPGTTGYLNRVQLIQLAASVVDTPAAQHKKLNPDSLKSISEAEEYSGLDLKAPALLPMNYEFSYARYFAYNKEIHLRYDGNGYLVIYEWRGKPLDFNKLSNTSYKNYEIVKVNGEPAFYGSTEGADPYLFLWWHTDGMNYQMYSYRYTDGLIGILNEKKMIAIAESMDDINDFQSDAPKPYSYLPAYERALEINFREFPTTPEGWFYENIWAEAYTECITVGYTSTEESSLSLSQCKKEPYRDIFDIPSSAVEQVKAGDKKAKYIVGWFGTDDQGVTEWKSELPIRQLIWREDDLWIRITIRKDTKLVYDKDNLISYAQSLR